MSSFSHTNNTDNNNIVTVGFLGCGHMAQAMIKPMQKSGKYHIIASAKHPKNFEGINVITNNKSVAENVEIIVLAVRPCDIPVVVAEIKDFVKQDTVVVSVAAGVSLNLLKNQLTCKVVRAMPNTAVSVDEGMTALCGDVSNDVKEIFTEFGKVAVIDEALMDTVVAVSGSSPAYAYMLMDIMIDFAIEKGMNLDTAVTFATQAVLGAAKMLQVEGNPKELIDKMCTPGGTTIEAVKKLKPHTNILIEAMQACYDQSVKL